VNCSARAVDDNPSALVSGELVSPFTKLAFEIAFYTPIAYCFSISQFFLNSTFPSYCGRIVKIKGAECLL
jgi:hypothetical protein